MNGMGRMYESGRILYWSPKNNFLIRGNLEVRTSLISVNLSQYFSSHLCVRASIRSGGDEAVSIDTTHRIMDNSHRECHQRIDGKIMLAELWDGKSQCKRCQCSLAKTGDAWVMSSCACKYCFACMQKILMS